jgi:hypothetical protein
MKKFKKLLSMLLTAAVVCGLSASPAMAETTKHEGQYGDGTTALTSLEFTKFLEIADGATIPSDTYTFHMDPDTTATGSLNSMTIYPGVALDETKSTVELRLNSSDTIAYNDNKYVKSYGVTETSSFDLSGIDFSADGEGIYRYKVYEEADSSNNHITFDSSVFVVDLYVDKTGNIIYIQASKNNDKQPIIFKNKCTTTTIEITKTVVGDFTDPEQEFEFEIKIPVGGDDITLEEGDVMNASKEDTNSTKTTLKDLNETEIIATGDKNDADSGWQTFTLRDGEKLIIDNVPVGLIFWVREKVDSNGKVGVYTPSYAIAQYTNTITKDTTYTNGNPEEKITTTSKNNIVAFVNTREDIDTGIVLDVMPYVVVVLIAAAGIVLFFRKRKTVR